jgi:hypothetical protein
MPIILVRPNWQLGGSLIRGLIRSREGPFAQRCLNETFGFAVGFRRIGPGMDVFDLKSAAGAREGKGFISRSIATFGSSLAKPPSERPRPGQGVSRIRVFKPIPERSAINRDPIPPDAVLVAIDIAKARIEASHHKRRRRLSVLNTRAEHDRLIEALKAYGKPVICAFEAICNYHRPMAWRLIEAGFAVRLVSSTALART